METQTQMSRQIAQDYIRYCLEKNGMNWDSHGRQVDITPTPAETAMRKLGDEFEERFKKRFDDMIRSLSLTNDNAQETFKAIMRETFSDGVNWGRIVALFGFSGRFAVQCYEKQMTGLNDNIVDWVTDYMDKDKLKDWMTSNNGWDGFVAFYQGGIHHRIDDSPDFSNILKTAAVGIAAAGIALRFFLKS